jgi:hypothetical protein
LIGLNTCQYVADRKSRARIPPPRRRHAELERTSKEDGWIQGTGGDRRSVTLDLSRSVNQMIEAIECHVEEIVFRIVRDARERNPFGDNLVAEVELRDLDLRPSKAFDMRNSRSSAIDAALSKGNLLCLSKLRQGSLDCSVGSHQSRRGGATGRPDLRRRDTRPMNAGDRPRA